MLDLLKLDYFMSHFDGDYGFEMRALAYSQLLESYRSLTLNYMADVFGVTVEYLEM